MKIRCKKLVTLGHFLRMILYLGKDSTENQSVSTKSHIITTQGLVSTDKRNELAH